MLNRVRTPLLVRRLPPARPPSPQYAEFNEVYLEFFADAATRPARVCFAVDKLPLGAAVEVVNLLFVCLFVSLLICICLFDTWFSLFCSLVLRHTESWRYVAVEGEATVAGGTGDERGVEPSSSRAAPSGWGPDGVMAAASLRLAFGGRPLPSCAPPAADEGRGPTATRHPPPALPGRAFSGTEVECTAYVN